MMDEVDDVSDDEEAIGTGGVTGGASGFDVDAPGVPVFGRTLVAGCDGLRRPEGSCQYAPSRLSRTVFGACLCGA